MPIERPPLLRLGGEEAFDAYQAEFDRLYRSGPVFDVLGRLVEFPRSACRHVCFKAPEADPYGRLPRDAWSQERAERIPWILEALSNPGTEVRPHLSDPAKQVYLPAVDGEGCPPEWFFVVVARVGPNSLEFVTAFRVPYDYWFDWRKGGPRIYPEPKQPAKPKKGRRHKSKGQGA